MASILLVDDHPANLLVLEAILDPLGQRLVRASSGEEALLRLRTEKFAVILLDVMMPGMDGLVTADLVREQAHGRELPIIFVTAGDIPALDGYAHGAVDLLRKPFDANVLRAKVRVFVELFHAREQVRRHAELIEAQERAAAARIAALLNASSDAVIGMDHAGNITEFNRAAEAMFGHRREDVLGRSLADRLVPPRLREPHRRGLAHYLATGESRVLDTRIEVPALRADGTEFPLELAIRRVVTDGPATFLGYASDLTARKRAEGARAFLAQASAALAGSLDYEVTLETIVRLAVPHLADWCMVQIVSQEPGTGERLAVAHVDPAKVILAKELRRRYPPDPNALQGAPQVLRSGRSELYEQISEQMLEASARDAEHLRILRELRLNSVMVVPIASRERVVGAITFVSAESARRYDAADLATAEDLARRAAMAIENARLYRETQVAEERNRFLAEATEALAASLDLPTTFERVARLAVPQIADSAAIYQLDEDGAIRLVVLAASDAEQEALARELNSLLPLRVDDDRLLSRVVRSGRSEILPEVSPPVREAWSPTSRASEIVEQLAIASYMAVPLTIRGRVLGALTLTTSTSGRRFGPTDASLAEELARRAGVAMENAQLYRDAQNANRLKDDFLATVSHELRTPLTAMLAWIQVLRTGRPEQVTRAIDTIERNSQVQARIVDDILDVSSVITGKLRLQLELLQLDDILRAAIDTVRPMADAKGIELVASLEPAGQIAGDPARLQQIAWNLLSNAIKFTPKGGRVEVRLAWQSSNAQLSVIDNGQGIRADSLPHVFDRFWQGDSASTRVHGGLGMGLAIVRHLVELHGGHVSVESPGEGRGAKFTVVLPIRGLASMAAAASS